MKLKRVLSMVLCLCMLLSCMPVTGVFAEEVAATAEQTVTIEAENTEYAIWNLYTAVDANSTEYSGGQGAGTMQKGTYPAFDVADTTEDLAGGFIDKSNVPYVAFTVDAAEAGSYFLSTASFFRFTAAYDNAYAVFMVNPADERQETVAYKGYYGAVNTDKLYMATEPVAVQLQEGRNVIYVISATADQNLNWANVDYLKITGENAVTPVAANTQTLFAGDAPYAYGYTTLNAGGSIGGGNWGGLGSTYLAIADMSAANANKLRSFAYTVNAPVDGYYDITVSFNSMTANDDAKAIGLLVDGKAQAREFIFNQVANDKGVNRNKGYIDISVYLTEGDHVLSITAPANRTSAETAKNSDWCDYAELVLHGGLTQSVIQSNPKMEWWYAEAEYYQQGYAVAHNYPNIETGHNNTYRDYNNANYSAYQSKCAIGGSAANNYTLAQLQEGRLDKSTTTGVSIYVEAPEAGSYDFYAYYRFNCPGVYGTSTPYGVFMVNGEFGAQAMFNAGGSDWSYNTDTVQLSLEKGLNEITFIPMTKDQYVSATDWASVDCIFVDTDLQVKKVPTGSVTVNPVDGTHYLFGVNTGDTMLEYGVKDLAETDGLTAQNLTKADLHKLAFTAYTVDAPYDGYYNISVVHTSKAANTPENYGFGLLVDDRPAEVKHITSNNATSDISTYLTAGTHTLTVTNLLPLNDTVKGVHWTNLGQVTLGGGLTLAAEQINPLTEGMSVMEAETDAYYNFTGMEKEYTKIEDSWLASGGKVVGGANASTMTYDQVMEHLSTDGQPYVEYVVEAAESGEYEVKLSLVSSFASGAEKYYLMQVNGEMIRVDAPPQGTKVVAYCVPVTVNLVKGRNVIRVLSGNLSQTASTWINQDYLAVPAGVTPCAPVGRTVMQADHAANTGNYNYKTGDGRYWDSDGLNNVLVSKLTLAQLNQSNFLDTSWYSVTVEAPADGYYPVQARVWIPTVETAQLGRIGMIANGETYEAKLWQDASSCTTAEAIVYLNKGVNDLIITGILADSNVAADGNSIYWMDADFAWICGGLEAADTQRYPVQGLIPGSVYTEENGTVSVPAGTSEEELKSNFYNGDMTGYTVVYDETKTVKSMGASQILALGNPVGRVLNYRNAVFMESSASGFTVSGELEGDVTITVRAEKGTSNGGVACLYVEVDGEVSEFAFNVTDTAQQLTIATGLEKGDHTIKVTKGTDAKYDMIYVYSVSYTGTLTETKAADMAIEFIGDSITVGYGLYEADVTKKNAMSGSYYSYANVAADILGADHYTIGNGAWRFGENTGAEGDTRYLGYIYEKNSMNLNLGSYDFAWQPDVIVINLGTNDANQYTFTGTETDQEVWSADMAALLTMVRTHNPNARIFWAYGAMEDVTTNADKSVVVPLIQNAIDAYNTSSGDDVTYVHVTNDVSGVYDHPTREGHIVIGEEVAVAILGVQTERLEAESDSVYWRYTAVEAGAVSNAVGGVRPGAVANMQSYADLSGGAELKKTENPMMSFVVDVETEGDYTLDVAYRAGFKTGTINDYFIVVGVDDESYTKTAYVGAHPDNSSWSLGQATVHLTAGRHVIRFITMVSETMSDTLYTNWINIDYVDVTGIGKVTAVAPDWTHLPSSNAGFRNNYNTPNDTFIANKATELSYTLKDWWNNALGGYNGDGKGITTENFNIYNLSKVGYFSYTVEVPADGFYDLQTYIYCGPWDTNDKFTSFANRRSGHIMLAVDTQINWYPAEFGYCELNWNAQNLSVYLTKGTHVLTVSGIIGELGGCSENWCTIGALSVAGGITVAETQIDPLTLIEKVDEIYVDAENGSDIATGTEDAPVKTLAKAVERINDGGIIHLIGTVPGAKGLPTFDGTVTITGGKLDISAFADVWMNSGLILDNVTVKFYEGGYLYANGHPLTVTETVTFENHPYVFGGGKSQDFATSELNLYGGDYIAIYGGGRWGKITDTARVTIGGVVNHGYGLDNVIDHDSGIDIFGGGLDAYTAKAEVTFGGEAYARLIYGAGTGGSSLTDETYVTITGGTIMGAYGGGAKGCDTGTTHLTMTGGWAEQVYGGNETSGDGGSLTGNVYITVTGGEITRRLAGGCYNGNITGNTYLTLGEGLNYSRTYSSGLIHEDITARCRTGSTGKAYLFFDSEEAKTKLSGELASDPADNWGVVDIKQWNVVLSDNVGVNFNIAVDENLRDVATIILTDGEQVTETAASSVFDGTYCVIENEKAAAQMTDSFTVQVVVDGYTVDEGEYSVQKYAKYILDDANGFADEDKKLVKEMLNYGAAAQTYFGYNTGNSAISGVDMTGACTENVPAEAPAITATGVVDGISFYGASLLFKSKVTVRLYFAVTGDIASYTFKAGDAVLTPTAKSGLYYVDVENITPDKLDQQVVVTVNDAITVKYSPLNYMVRMNGKDTTTDTLKALLKAMYNYHLAAVSFSA